MRASLDDVGMAIARAWATRGTCARRQVGCALFDSTGHLVSTGYNGPASRQAHCTDTPCPGANLPSGTGLEKCEAIHAEANALLRCADVTRVHTAYVTHSPCLDCVKLLMNTSCRRVVYGEPYAHDAQARERWLTPRGEAGTLMRMIEVRAPPPYTWEHYGRTRLRAWAVVDMRHKLDDGRRYVESVTVTDSFGVPTEDRPPELPGWKVVPLEGYYEEPAPEQFVHGHCACPTPAQCSLKGECAKGYTSDQRKAPGGMLT